MRKGANIEEGTGKDKALQELNARIAQLNERLARDGHGPVGIERFRPNIVLAGIESRGFLLAAPLAIALATRLFPNRFTADEREAGPAAAVLGLAFISEGAIPFAARDPFRVIPSLMAGSAITPTMRKSASGPEWSRSRRA